MNLDPHTIEALRYKAAIAADEVASGEERHDPVSDIASWRNTFSACNSAADTGTIESLAASKLAQEELGNYLEGDREKAECRAILRDLCRAGYFDRHDPNAVYIGRPPRCMTVDGIKYLVGSYE